MEIIAEMIITDPKALPKFQSLAADSMLLSISQATIKEKSKRIFLFPIILPAFSHFSFWI